MVNSLALRGIIEQRNFCVMAAMMQNNRFGLKVKELRQERKWTQEFLAFKSGLAVSTVAHIGQGRQADVSWVTLDRLDKVLNQRGKLIAFYRNRQN